MPQISAPAAITLGYIIAFLNLPLVQAQLVIEWRDTEALIIKAEIVGVQGNALVDTGATAFVVTEEMAEKILSNRKSNSVTIRTLTGGRVGREFENVDMQIAGLSQRTGPVVTIPDRDLDRIGQIYGRDLPFCVGMPILENCVLSFENQCAVVSESVSNFPLTGQEYEIEYPATKSPACRCDVGRNRRLMFRIDTGCDSPISLESEFAKALCSSGEAIRVVRNGQIKPGNPEMLVLREVQVFGTVFRNVPALTGGINVVGFGLLRHMKFTLDFPNNRVLVPDPPQAGRDWFPIDASGLRIVRKEDRLTRVRRIVENSSGDDAGLKVDDVIIAVNGTPALEMSRYEVEEVLSKPGTTAHLDIERDGKALKIGVPLEHPFEYPPKWPPRPEPSKDQLDFEKFLEEQAASKPPAESETTPKVE